MSLIDVPRLPPDRMSRADRLIEAGLWTEFYESLSDDDAEAILWDWSFWRRPDQTVPPGDWSIWQVRAGRGFGKTRTGAETVRERVETGMSVRIGLIAPTAADGRDVMVEGESGIMAVSPPWNEPKYEPSKRRLTWPNGAVGTVYSAEEPKRLRGPQHDFIWGDEPASWPDGQDVLDNARFGLRIGRDPRMILTGTPQPKPWLIRLWDEPHTLVTTGSLYDNLLNLAPEFVDVIMGRYEGTRLGRQEIWAEVLDDVEGALWAQSMIERTRMDEFDRRHPWTALQEWLALRGAMQPMDRRRSWRTIVAVDPPGETAECGIVVGTAPVNGAAGRDHCVILADESISGRPEEWGAAVVGAIRRWDAQGAYVESNQGGDMVRSTVHAVDPNVVVSKITASESKKARAEPVSALYEKGWVHHLGFHPKLEEQMVTWVANESKSPDRLDALVHAVRELIPDRPVGKTRVSNPATRRW